MSAVLISTPQTVTWLVWRLSSRRPSVYTEASRDGCQLHNTDAAAAADDLMTDDNDDDDDDINDDDDDDDVDLALRSNSPLY